MLPLVKTNINKKMYYSNCISPLASSGAQGMYLSRIMATNEWMLESDMKMRSYGKMVMFDFNGELLKVQKLDIPKGKHSKNMGELKVFSKQIYLVAVYLNNRLVFMHRFNHYPIEFTRTTYAEYFRLKLFS